MHADEFDKFFSNFFSKKITFHFNLLKMKILQQDIYQPIP